MRWAVLFVACGGCAPSEPIDASLPDAGPDTTGSLGYPRSPDGLGWCCPVSYGCGCVPYGGFAETETRCFSMRICDGAPPYSMGTDEHGCPYVYPQGSCLAFDAGLIEDAPATEDAGTSDDAGELEDAGNALDGGPADIGP